MGGNVHLDLDLDLFPFFSPFVPFSRGCFVPLFTHRNEKGTKNEFPK